MKQIVRTPIKGTRKPIKGIRTPIMEGGYHKLDWDEIYKGLVNYIKFAAKQVSEQYGTGSSLQTAEDLFQEGQLLLYKCYTMYDYKPRNEFDALFKSSLWRKLRTLASKKEFTLVDISDAYDLGYSETVVNDMYEEYKLQQIVELLENDDIALTILREFINPSKRTLWEAEMDIARKQMLKEQNYNISVPQSLTIKGVHIQRALEITKVEFKEHMSNIKKTINMVYDHEKICRDSGEDPDYETFVCSLKDKLRVS